MKKVAFLIVGVMTVSMFMSGCETGVVSKDDALEYVVQNYDLERVIYEYDDEDLDEVVNDERILWKVDVEKALYCQGKDVDCDVLRSFINEYDPTNYASDGYEVGYFIGDWINNTSDENEMNLFGKGGLEYNLKYLDYNFCDGFHEGFYDAYAE